MKSDVLQSLEQYGIQNAFDVLLAYTNNKLKWRKWRHGKASGTKGEEAADFVHEAITKALTEWNWNKEKKSDVIDYLKSRIDSLISNSLNLEENKKSSAINLHEHGGALNVRSSIMTGEDILINEGEIGRIKQLILTLKRDADDLINEVLDAMDAGFDTADDISTVLNISIDDVYNYTRRIRRKLREPIPKNQKTTNE